MKKAVSSLKKSFRNVSTKRQHDEEKDQSEQKLGSPQKKVKTQFRFRLEPTAKNQEEKRQIKYIELVIPKSGDNDMMNINNFVEVITTDTDFRNSVLSEMDAKFREQLSTMSADASVVKLAEIIYHKKKDDFEELSPLENVIVYYTKERIQTIWRRHLGEMTISFGWKGRTYDIEDDVCLVLATCQNICTLNDMGKHRMVPITTETMNCIPDIQRADFVSCCQDLHIENTKELAIFNEQLFSMVCNKVDTTLTMPFLMAIDENTSSSKKMDTSPNSPDSTLTEDIRHQSPAEKTLPKEIKKNLPTTDSTSRHTGLQSLSAKDLLREGDTASLDNVATPKPTSSPDSTVTNPNTKWDGRHQTPSTPEDGTTLGTEKETIDESTKLNTTSTPDGSSPPQLDAGISPITLTKDPPTPFYAGSPDTHASIENILQGLQPQGVAFPAPSEDTSTEHSLHLHLSTSNEDSHQSDTTVLCSPRRQTHPGPLLDVILNTPPESTHSSRRDNTTTSPTIIRQNITEQVTSTSTEETMEQLSKPTNSQTTETNLAKTGKKVTLSILRD